MSVYRQNKGAGAYKIHPLCLHRDLQNRKGEGPRGAIKTSSRGRRIKFVETRHNPCDIRKRGGRMEGRYQLLNYGQDFIWRLVGRGTRENKKRKRGQSSMKKQCGSARAEPLLTLTALMREKDQNIRIHATNGHRGVQLKIRYGKTLDYASNPGLGESGQREKTNEETNCNVFVSREKDDTGWCRTRPVGPPGAGKRKSPQDEKRGEGKKKVKKQRAAKKGKAKNGHLRCEDVKSKRRNRRTWEQA